jgi:WD40 repeat protein
MGTLAGTFGSMMGCAFDPSGRRVVGVGSDGAIQIVDVDSGQRVATPAVHESNVHACAWSPDGSRIATGCERGTLNTWSAESGEEIASSDANQS